ncbi:MAG: Gfo/Idh/MocA family oxidoreductase [Acholeplasmataceae bacterium]|nr:Gfo/Idh/MocA family oxidoreductase [Acholeplasmataceae bacterium]
MANYGIAIIGYGGIGAYHAEHIINTKSLRLKGIFDIKKDRNDLAKSKNIHVYESLDHLLHDLTVDIVLIATPNDSHYELVMHSLHANKHVICEKPVTLSTKLFDEMSFLSQKQKRELIVHQNRRWDSDFLTVKKIIDSHLIGEVFHIESRVHGGNGIPGDWRRKRDQGGGMLYDWGVHLIDQIMLLKDAKIIKYSIDFSTILGHEVDDGFLLHLYFDDSTDVLIEVQTTNFIKLPRWYVKGLNGTAIINDWNLDGYINQLILPLEETHSQTVKAGNGLTKTMAPPSEDAINKMKLPPILVEPNVFYEHVCNALEKKESLSITHGQIRVVLSLIENLMNTRV